MQGDSWIVIVVVWHVARGSCYVQSGGARKWHQIDLDFSYVVIQHAAPRHARNYF